MQKKTYRKILLIVLITPFLILSSCDSDTNYAAYEPHYKATIDGSKLPKENRPMTMFEDSENPTKMYDKSDRWFRVNQPLQVIQKTKDSVQISLYSPVGLSDVKIATFDFSLAISAISGRFVLSRSPPQPTTVINCSLLVRIDSIVFKTLSNASGVCA